MKKKKRLAVIIVIVFLIIGGLFKISYSEVVYEAIGGYKDFTFGMTYDEVKSILLDKLFPAEDQGEPLTYYTFRDYFLYDSVDVYFGFYDNLLKRVWIVFSNPHSPDEWTDLFQKYQAAFLAKYGPITKSYMPKSEDRQFTIGQLIKMGRKMWYAEWDDNYGKLWMVLAGSEGEIYFYIYFDSKDLQNIPGVQSGLQF